MPKTIFMNMDDTNRLDALLQLWYEDKLDPQDEEAFFQLLNQAHEQQALSQAMRKAWEQKQEAAFFHHQEKEAFFQNIIPRRKARVFTLWQKSAVAACLLLVIGAAILFQMAPDEKTKPLSKAEIPPSKPDDIKAPEANRAFLTLSDGRKLVLDSARPGRLLTEGDVGVAMPEEGKLVYSGGVTAIKYHTLTVPKGSKPFSLTLPDGSSVTVNVASSLTFPTAFSGPARKVAMTGEAYFEVVRHTLPDGKNQPFVVAANGTEVEVLGTRFNVNAYEDEAFLRTTLLEGVVKVKSDQREQLLAPGQQALVGGSGPGGNIRLVKNADLAEAMAWINGKFYFNNAGVETVMRQVARWYDVQVTYAARPDLRFGGQIDRNSTLRQVLTILKTSGLHFSIEGKKVTVLP